MNRRYHELSRQANEQINQYLISDLSPMTWAAAGLLRPTDQFGCSAEDRCWLGVCARCPLVMAEFRHLRRCSGGHLDRVVDILSGGLVLTAALVCESTYVAMELPSTRPSPSSTSNQRPGLVHWGSQGLHKHPYTQTHPPRIHSAGQGCPV